MQKRKSMRNRILFLLIFAFLSASALNAEPWIGQGTQNSPYIIKFGYGAGQVQYQYGLSGPSSSIRGTFEYNPRNLGFEIGVNQSDYRIPPDRATQFMVASILGTIAPDRFGLYLFTAAQVDKPGFSQAYLDLGPTYHFNPGQKWDPYIGIGIGIGGSRNLRGYSKLGIRFNFERSFLYFELEGASINRYYGGNQYVYSEASGIFGYGLYFGGSSTNSDKKEESLPPPVAPKEETPLTPVEEKKETPPRIEEEKKDPLPAEGKPSDP